MVYTVYISNWADPTYLREPETAIESGQFFFVLVQFTSSKSRLVWTFGGFRYNIGGRLTSIVENIICQDFTNVTGNPIELIIKVDQVRIPKKSLIL